MRIVSFIVITLLFISGCSPQTIKPTLKVGEVTRSVFYAPLYLAVANGYFQAEGLSVDITTIPGGDKTMTALLAKQIDIALVGPETTIYVAQQQPNDAPVNFAQLTKRDGTLLMQRTKSVFRWENMKQKSFIAQRQGGMPHIVSQFVLRQHGLDWNRDIKAITNIDFVHTAQAFASGTGDYIQLFEPTASAFADEKIGYVAASFAQHSGLLPYTTFAARQTILKGKEQQLIAFTRAIARAERELTQQSAREIATQIQPFFETTSLPLLTKAINRYKQLDVYATTPLITEASWSQLMMMMKEAKALERPIAYRTLVNTTIVKKALRE